MQKSATTVCMAVAVFLSFIAVPPRTAGGAGPEWVVVDRNKESVFSYDKPGIVTTGKGILRVTTRVVYTEKGKAETRKALNSAVEYENLSESRFAVDLDCRQRKSRLLRVTHYDRTGKIIKSFDLEGITEWEDLPHDARMEEVANSACGR